MTMYDETYRGRGIRVVRDDAYPVVLLTYRDGGTTACVTVAQARRMVDHFEDRSCAAHGYCSGDAAAELREHGPYAGVVDTASSVSRQHYIDTGRYLHVGEVDTCDDGCGLHVDHDGPCRAR